MHDDVLADFSPEPVLEQLHGFQRDAVEHALNGCTQNSAIGIGQRGRRHAEADAAVGVAFGKNESERLQVAQQIGSRLDASHNIEYWKSAAYPLNYLAETSSHILRDAIGVTTHGPEKVCPDNSRSPNVHAFAVRDAFRQRQVGRPETGTARCSGARRLQFTVLAVSAGLDVDREEGLDFHWYCHAVVHWNLPANPVELEQREGRVHRFKGHAIRKNIASGYFHPILENGDADVWEAMFQLAALSTVSGIFTHITIPEVPG